MSRPPAGSDPCDAFDLDDHGDLVVILCHFNPCSYHTPVRNLMETLRWLHAERLPTYAIELCYARDSNSRPALPTCHPKVLQLDGDSVLFCKEDLWNICAANLPEKFKYVLCLDADVFFVGDAWRRQLEKELERSKVVQPFSCGVWTDSARRRYKSKPSTIFAYRHSLPNADNSKLFHPGFAVALWRDFWTQQGGFLALEPVGGGSNFLMNAIIGRPTNLEATVAAVSTSLAAEYAVWASRIQVWAGDRIGYIQAEAWHLWHGSSKNRRHVDKLQILAGFEPKVDLIRTGSFGLLQWSNSARATKKQMISDIEDYFRGREEDEWYDSSYGS